tara:strand:+ start:8161 stop:9027 length:867 start_codon:yes stop_codon:yes gene_type:complete
MVRLRKRKRGKEDYYYLEHSLRRNGKVVKEEKYLGKEIPKDIETVRAEFLKELRSDLYDKLKRIKINFQKEWKKIPASVKKKELEEISIAFTYNTNAIEGSTITLEETREIIHDKISPNKSLYDVRETEEHSKVFLGMLQKRREIDDSLILEWHKEIFGETKKDLAGKYRDYLVSVGSYLAIDWQEVEKEMKKLFSFVRKAEREKMNPIELAGKAHYRFEKIHPFGDGNGRIGRLLMNHILWHAGWPMLIIEYKGRKSYYKAFTKKEEDFLNYFMRRYLSVHKIRLTE